MAIQLKKSINEHYTFQSFLFSLLQMRKSALGGLNVIVILLGAIHYLNGLLKIEYSSHLGQYRKVASFL